MSEAAAFRPETWQPQNYPLPPPGIDYYNLEPNHPDVIDRFKAWYHFPVAFCKEAMNWHPHWYQEELLADESKFIAACWSRQIGKSEAIAHKAIHMAFTHPDSDIVIIAPARRQAIELYRKIIKALRKSPLISQSLATKPTQEQTTFLNGSRILNLPAGEEGVTVRGYSIALLILEEAAFIPEDVIIAIEQGLASTGGSEIMISTPHGRNNNFYKTFVPSVNEGYDFSRQGRQQIREWACYRYDYNVGFHVFKADTKPPQPQLAPAHVKVFKSRLPEWRFKAEYEALFVQDVDSYWPFEIIDAVFNTKFEKMNEPKIDSSYFFGVDIAKGGDYTAVSIGQRFDVNPYTLQPLNNPHVQVVNRAYWKIGKIEAQYPLLIGLTEQWQPLSIYFDKTSLGERPFEELTETYGLPIEGVNFSGGKKVELYGTLTLLMNTDSEIEEWNKVDEDGTVHIAKRFQSYYDQEAKNQYEAMIYEIPMTLSKQTGVKHPTTGYKIYAAQGHDDIPDADALLCMCVSSGDIGLDYYTTAKNPLSKEKPKDRDKFDDLYGFASISKTGKGDNRTDRKNPYRRHKKVFW